MLIPLKNVHFILDVVGDCNVDVSKIPTGEVEEMIIPLQSECQDSGIIRIALGSYM